MYTYDDAFSFRMGGVGDTDFKFYACAWLLVDRVNKFGRVIIPLISCKSSQGKF